MYTWWSGVEEELQQPLDAIAHCVEQCSNETEQQIQHLSEVLVPVLHEYVLCADTLKVSFSSPEVKCILRSETLNTLWLVSFEFKLLHVRTDA